MSAGRMFWILLAIIIFFMAALMPILSGVAEHHLPDYLSDEGSGKPIKGTGVFLMVGFIVLSIACLIAAGAPTHDLKDPRSDNA